MHPVKELIIDLINKFNQLSGCLALKRHRAQDEKVSIPDIPLINK
jgi:hypothetical protein